MHKIRVCYIISRISKSLEYEWLVQYLNKDKFCLSIILMHEKHTPLEDFLILHNVSVIRIKYRDKRNLPAAIFKIYRSLTKEKPDIINCNLVDAQLAGLIAGRFAGIKHRVYTRHHTVFHHYYTRHGVLYDKLSNFLSTKIIAITGLVKRVLTEMEGVATDKVEVIPYGFDFSTYSNIGPERTDLLKIKHKLAGTYPVIGVISRYTHWKGLQYIIPAFEELLKTHPAAVLVLAGAGGGDMDKEIRKMLASIPTHNYREIPFENDIAGLFSCFDLFVHAPIDEWVEAFGRIYVEALASSVPSVFTMSGIAHDFIVDKRNALVVPYKSEESLTSAMLQLIADEDLKSQLSLQGKKDVEKDFTIKRNIQALESLFENLVHA